MKNYSFFICCALTCLLSAQLYAQGENNNWCFGWKLGLSFNTAPPVFFTDSMYVVESSSSVSDASGNLLFYTSGPNIWDRNHNRMPNDFGMAGNGPLGPGGQSLGSSAQGVVVVQSPVNNNQYYIMTTDANESTVFNAYYSVVDMSLNGGLGDVVAGQKSILFATEVGEGVLAGRAEDCTGYWVIVRKRVGPDYLSFRIDANGFSMVPVTSSGTLNVNWGAMCLNPAGDRLVRCSVRTETAAFDKATGVLSNFLTIDTATWNTGYYPIFSPDGSKLYGVGTGIYQYDISLLPDAVAVRSSRTLIDTSQWGRPRLDPGGKLYSLKTGPSGYLGRIDNPNNAGLACGFVGDALTVPPPFLNGFSELGSDALVNVPPADTFFHVLDTTICFQPEATLSADPSGSIYRLWSTGSTGIQESFTQSGTYWVYNLKDCSAYIDTFHLRFTGFDLSLGSDTSLCAGDSLLLDISTDGAGYVWQDGTSGPDYTVYKEGVYYVSVNKGPCTLSDTVVVDIIHPSLDIPEQDSTICKGEPVALHALSTPGGSYLWSTGSTAASIVINGAGTYTVSATTVCGILNDSVRIAEEDCNCDAFVPNAFSPNGDGKNDILEVRLHCPQLSTYTFTIYNRYGQQVYQSAWPGQGWDGYHNGAPADMGTYFFYLRYKDNAGKETIKRGDILLLR